MKAEASGEMVGRGDPYLPHDPPHTRPGSDMNLPIYGQDPDHTLGGRPVSNNTLEEAVNNRELLY